jgi:hypothetical protein
MTPEDFRDVRYEVCGRVEGIECHNVVKYHVDRPTWLKIYSVFCLEPRQWNISDAINGISI